MCLIKIYHISKQCGLLISLYNGIFRVTTCFSNSGFCFTSAILHFVFNYHNISLRLITKRTIRDKVSLYNILCKKDSDIPHFTETIIITICCI